MGQLPRAREAAGSAAPQVADHLPTAAPAPPTTPRKADCAAMSACEDPLLASPAYPSIPFPAAATSAAPTVAPVAASSLAVASAPAAVAGGANPLSFTELGAHHPDASAAEHRAFHNCC